MCVKIHKVIHIVVTMPAKQSIMTGGDMFSCSGKNMLLGEVARKNVKKYYICHLSLDMGKV